MTLPDEMVQSVMEKLANEWAASSDEIDESDVRFILQAAFAKLPECEEATNPFDPRKDLGEWNGWNACLITLVRKFRSQHPRLCLLHGQPLGPAPATNCAECRAEIDHTLGGQE